MPSHDIAMHATYDLDIDGERRLVCVVGCTDDYVTVAWPLCDGTVIDCDFVAMTDFTDRAQLAERTIELDLRSPAARPALLVWP